MEQLGKQEDEMSMKNENIHFYGYLRMIFLVIFICLGNVYGYTARYSLECRNESADDPEFIRSEESDTEVLDGQVFCIPEANHHEMSDSISASGENRWNLKTNLPFWGILWMNAAVEYKLSDNWSVDLSVYYNPVRYARSFTMKTFMIQPSLRYWFLPEMTGHFWGVHLATSIYNVAVDNEIRYQDTSYPLLGIGVDYGYALHFNDCWGMEFNVGIGYMHTHYETFYNVENGSRISSGYYNYFGITRAGVSLIYRF